MKNVSKLVEQLQNLFNKKHKRDEIFRAFGIAQCHQLDWQIDLTKKQIMKEILK